MIKLTREQVTDQDLLRLRREDWLRDNPGIITSLAEKLKVSKCIVSRVFNGRDKSFAIEKALAKLGAPGIDMPKPTRRRRSAA